MILSNNYTSRLSLFAWKLISIGVDEQTSLKERKITRLLNIYCIAGLPVTTAFLIINWYEHKLPLAIMNVLIIMGDLLIIFINSYRKYLTSRLILSFLSTVLFTVSTLLYNNGAQYYLMLNIVTTVILFDNKFYVIAIASFNAILFLIIEYFKPQQFVIGSVSQTRVLFSITWTLFFIIVALQYYKKENTNYLRVIEESARKLERQQEQLIQQKIELEEKTLQLGSLNTTKEKIFSVIAHDMRSPLAGLKTSLDLYSNDIISNDEFKMLTQGLSFEVDNLYNNLDNLLRWSQSQLNGIKVTAEVIGLKNLILETVSLLTQNAKQKRIFLEHHISDNLKIYADADQTKVILRNIISNAIKFTRTNGKIEITAEAKNDKVDIFIKDNGVGMSNEQRQHIFNSSIQSKRGTSNEKGTGLGLALCLEFLEKNKGHLQVVSNEGEGSLFIISLPAKA